MIDASHEPFEKNVEICRKVVEYAHKHNCVVEGELGMLVGAQHDDGEEGGGYSKGGCYTHPGRSGGIREADRRGFARRRHRQLAMAPTNSKANNISTSNASKRSRKR